MSRHRSVATVSWTLLTGIRCVLRPPPCWKDCDFLGVSNFFCSPFALCTSTTLVAKSEHVPCARCSPRCLINLSHPPDNPRKCRVVTVP